MVVDWRWAGKGGGGESPDSQLPADSVVALNQQRETHLSTVSPQTPTEKPLSHPPSQATKHSTHANGSTHGQESAEGKVPPLACCAALSLKKWNPSVEAGGWRVF